MHKVFPQTYNLACKYNIRTTSISMGNRAPDTRPILNVRWYINVEAVDAQPTLHEASMVSSDPAYGP